MAKPSKSVAIYELQDPTDGRTYYVGKSIQPKRRLLQHLEDAKRRPSSAKGKWLNNLTSTGRVPKLVLAAVVNEEEWMRAEAIAIETHLRNGSPLTNVVVPSGRRNRRFPNVDMRDQDFWDDLTYQLAYEGESLQRRMWTVLTPEGVVPYFAWNLNNRGWRFHQVVYSAGWNRVSPMPPKRGGPGFNSHRHIANYFNWSEEAIYAWIWRDEYEISLPLEEALSPLELGEHFGLNVRYIG